MAFVKCRPKIVKEDTNKLILRENFNPQGQPFSKTIDVNEYDLTSNCTFFCDVEVSNSTEETLISVGRDIDTYEGNTYPRSVLHFLYPVSDNLSIYLTCRVSNDRPKRITTAVGVSGNRLKIAFNSNGMVVNGADVSMAAYAEYYERLYSDLSRALEIGSSYGNHSNEQYNEISIIKNYLTIAQMEELTTL